ncbi:MAG: PQQ-binding-like beta-propeller repeat protein, partial [Bryobacterales bacterium]|nr:PQQ-binding-like beta-propeller repeat protein [Bryobacterales bacterium]
MRLAFLALPCLALAADWPMLRGPNGHGIAPPGTSLPASFGPQKNVLWRVDVPVGKSSPILAGKKLCLSAATPDALETLCLARDTGRLLWRQTISESRREKRHDLNHPASPTPVTDGTNLYVFFSDFGLVSYTLDGKERWRLPLGPFSNLHGMAASPVLAGHRLILACDQDTNAFLMAIHKDTGKQLWKADRSDFTHSFSSPAVWQPKDRLGEVIMPGAYQMISYSLETGEKRWWLRGLTWQPKSAPLIAGDTLYFNGWAPGGDPGQQKDLPPFEDVIRLADQNGDGKLQQGEVPPDLKHSGSWGAIDLDHDDALNARDWSFYRARRAARNSMMAIKLGGSGDITGSHILWR